MKHKVELGPRRLDGFVPDPTRKSLSGWRLEHFVLRRSSCDVSCQRWKCGGVSLEVGSGGHPLRARGDFPGETVCVGYMRKLGGPAWMNGSEAGPETMEFYCSGCESDNRAADPQWVAISLDEQTLQKVAHMRLGRELKLPKTGAMSFLVSGSEKLSLQAHARRLRGSDEMDPGEIEALVAMLAEFLDRLQPKGVSGLLRRSLRNRRFVERAESYLSHHVGDGFNETDLARWLGMSVRSLQRQFADIFGVTPQQWARCHALHHARKLLMEADPERVTVEGIACGAGFRHMGRFASYYRDLFGEFPSVTLRKSFGEHS